jgi:hypothetical protein
MKTPLCAAVTAGLLLTGCGERPAQSTSATNNAANSASVATAPADYLSTITKGEQRAVKTVDTASLDQAIQLFNVDHGRFPKDLNELVAEKYVAIVPTPPYGTKLDYDATAGRVKVVGQ